MPRSVIVDCVIYLEQDISAARAGVGPFLVVNIFFQLVREQWEQIEGIYKKHFLHVFKAPLVGRASDGDSGRKKAMLLSTNGTSGTRYTHVQMTTLLCLVRSLPVIPIFLRHFISTIKTIYI